MVKVLIVDDEILLRRGMKEKIDWDSMGFEIIGEAQNGKEAFDLALHLKPDIVITDMKMPVIDGQKLMEMLSNEMPSIKIIVISGYSDFEYTKKAIVCNAFDYILKPVKKNELIKVLEKVKAEIEKQAKNKEKEAHSQILFNENYLLLKDKLLSFYLGKEAISDEDVKRQFRKLDIVFKYKAFSTIVISLNDYHKIIESKYQGDREFFDITVINVIQKILNKYKNGMVFRNIKTYNEFIVLYGFEEEKPGFDHPIERVKYFVEEIQDIMNSKLDVFVNIGIGNMHESLKDLPASYREACTAVTEQILNEGNNIIYIGNFKGFRGNGSSYPHEKEKILMKYVESGQGKETLECIKDFFEFYKSHEGMTLKNLYKVCISLLLQLEKVLEKNNTSLNEIFSQDIAVYEVVSQNRSSDELEKWFINVMGKVLAFINDKRARGSKLIIRDIVNYICEYYYEEIDLGFISAKYHLNKNYFCKLFKDETGENFIDYLTRIRMEKAAVLLENNQMKISDIANLTGYEDTGYFSKVFKKFFNMNPNDYRKKINN